MNTLNTLGCLSVTGFIVLTLSGCATTPQKGEVIFYPGCEARKIEYVRQPKEIRRTKFQVKKGCKIVVKNADFSEMDE